MNDFVPYAIQAPPLKRHTRQRFTEFDYSFSFVTQNSPDDGNTVQETNPDESTKEETTAKNEAGDSASEQNTTSGVLTHQETVETTDSDKQESPEHMKSERNGFIPNTEGDDTNANSVDMNLGERWPSTWWTQYSTLCERSIKQNFSAVLTKIDLLRHILLGTIFGIVYWQLEHTEERLHDIRGVVSGTFSSKVIKNQEILKQRYKDLFIFAEVSSVV